MSTLFQRRVAATQFLTSFASWTLFGPSARSMGDRVEDDALVLEDDHAMNK